TPGGPRAVRGTARGWGGLRPWARFRGAAEELGEPLQVLRPTSCFCSLPPQSSDSAACWLPLCRITALWGDLRSLSIKSHRQIPRHDAISGGTNRFCSSSGRVPAYVRLLRLAPPPRSASCQYR